MKKVNNWIDGLTYGDEIKKLAEGIGKGSVWQYSVFVAYYTAVSLFPLVVGIFNAWNYYNLPPDRLIQSIQKLVPGPFARWLAEDLMQIYDASHVAILVVAAVTTVWTVSWAMAAMQMGMNSAYGVKHRKNILVLRLIAFLVTFVFAGVGGLLFGIILLVGGPGWLTALMYVASAFLLIGMLYYLVPNVQQHWRDVLPGTVFATIIFVLAVTVYDLFMRLIPETSTFYTTLGAFTFLMVLLQMFNMMLLIGGVMNAMLLEKKYEEVREKNDGSKFLRSWDKVKKTMKRD